jgi:glutamate-1-semialdehyde 2,1-aminomutase
VVSHAPSLVTLFLTDEAPTDFTGAQRCDTKAYGALCRALLERGIYPPPSQFEAWFVSLAHDDDAIDRTCEAIGDSLAEVLG